MKPEEEALKRAVFIEQRQAALLASAEGLQSSLLNRLVQATAAIYASPDTAIDTVFDTFTREEGSAVVLQFAKDIVGIGKLNAEYFGKVVDLPERDYKSIKSDSEAYLLKRFGLNAQGQPVRNGFLESFIVDPTVRRTIKQHAYKSVFGGVGLDQYRAELGALVVGQPGAGPIVKHYKTFALDTYQQADREVQERVAERLELTCFLYAGGLIVSSRSFCKGKNGKVFTREEAQAWKNLSFDGKPTNYDPLRDLGGYGCRHHKNYITNAQAIRRRPELADLLTPSKTTSQPEAEAEEVRQTPPSKPVPKPDSPKTYASQVDLEEAIDSGGWDIMTTNLSLETYNQVGAGIDLKRIGNLMTSQLESAGLVNVKMKVKESNGAIRFNVDADSKDGTGNFSMTRRFAVEDGLKVVDHLYLEIPKSLQGKGFTKELFGNWYQEYKAADIIKINVHANIDVGGYAWAKYGFEAEGKFTVDGVLNHASSRIGKDKKLIEAYGQMSRTFDRFYDENPITAPFPMDLFANTKGGKELLLGSDWFGSLNMKNPERRAMWEAYLGKK